MSAGFSGMNAWIIQRLSGIFIGAFTLVFLFVAVSSAPQNYSDWVGIFGSPLMQISCSLFFVALLFHAWVGLRDIVLDYVHPVGIKIMVFSVILMGLFGSGIWALKALYWVNLT